jgi:hypothetical protein
MISKSEAIPFAILRHNSAQRVSSVAPCVYIVRGEFAVGVPSVDGLTIIFDDAPILGRPVITKFDRFRRKPKCNHLNSVKEIALGASSPPQL